MRRFCRLSIYAVALVPPLLVFSITFADLWSTLTHASPAVEAQAVALFQAPSSAPIASPSPWLAAAPARGEYAWPDAALPGSWAIERPQHTPTIQATPTVAPTHWPTRPSTAIDQPALPKAEPTQPAPAPARPQSSPPAAPASPPPVSDDTSRNDQQNGNRGKGGKDDKSGKGDDKLN